MTINFILPFAGNKPIGGFKIVYEYANRLAEKGHIVNLIHPSYTFKESALNNTKYFLRYYQRKLDKSYNPDGWFQLDPKVNSLWIREISNDNVPDGDVLIATAWRTVTCSQNLERSKGEKFYFIQHHETWNGPEDEVNATWKMPFKKIVISGWLKDIADSMGEKAYYVPNAFDFSEFGIDVLPENRDRNKVMMLYNDLEFKGSEYGLQAFKKLKADFPELEITLFGVPQKPDGLPGWMKYYQTPERLLLRKLYNDSSVFLSPSLAEGFPLPPAEAMMCGAALACTDIGGHREYARDNETAILFKPKDSDEVVNALKKLLSDDESRIRLAYKGNEFIKQFTWEKAVNNFEKVLESNE
ncbi:MAG: glycosyltransferase family 4 protein [Ignavibacteria bacterium]|nr:glycosyltransferase family 4 protein [Ignavibacteria bacterium]